MYQGDLWPVVPNEFFSTGIEIKGFLRSDLGTLATTEARLELYFSLQLSIVTCGIVGAHSVILAVDSYLYTSFSFITLNILKRALHTDFRSAFTTAPLQTNGEVPGQRVSGCAAWPSSKSWAYVREHVGI